MGAAFLLLLGYGGKHMIDESLIVPGVVVESSDGLLRRIITYRDGNDVFYSRVIAGKAVGIERCCWITTICSWSARVVPQSPEPCLNDEKIKME
jgi:hypothetical protein